MKLIRFTADDGRIYQGVERTDDMAELVAERQGSLQPTGDVRRVERILAPVMPTAIFGIGRNYAAHIQETGAQADNYPPLFMKPTTSVIGPGDAIRLPACSLHGPEVDYEAELAVVIGKTARNVAVENALDYVLGYTCANDISARRWQKHAGAGQWVRGKGFDTFCPLGPCLITADAISDPQSLRLITRLNGQIMQDGTTADMIFSVAQIISYLSQDTTLLPGTVILTGTPDGVGFTRTPPVFLQPGDTIEIEIDGIGVLRNTVGEAE